MSILILLLGLGILLWISNINNRLNALEAASKGLAPEVETRQEPEKPAEPVVQIETVVDPVITEPVAPVPSPVYAKTAETVTETYPESAFTTWLKTDWQIKLGALLLLISFGWFARYAFMHDWIGPVGRITLGIAAGIVIGIFGTYRLKTQRTQGEIFLVLGSSIVLVTIFAARYYYQLFTPFSALAAMFIVSVLVAIVSAKEKNPLLAFTGLIVGGIAPLLTVTTEPNPFGLFTYLLAITLGSMWLAFLHERRSLIAAGLGIYTFYTLVHADPTVLVPPNAVMLGIFFVFAALFAAANVTDYIKTKSNEHLSDIVVALINNVILLFWINTLAPEPWKIGLMLAWSALFAACAFACRKFGATKELWSIYYSSAITLLGVATAKYFNGNTLVIAFTLEALAVIAATHAIKKDFNVTRRMVWLFALPVLMSIETIASPLWLTGPVLSLVVTLGLIAVSCIGLGFVLRHLSDKTFEAKTTVTTLMTIGTTYLYVILERLLNSEALIVAFTAMGLAVIAATHLVKGNFVTTRRLSWLLALPAFMSIETITSARWENGIVLPLVATLGIIAAACIVLGFALRHLSDKTDESKLTIAALFTVGTTYLYVILERLLNGDALIASFTGLGLAVITATHFVKKDFTTTRRLSWLMLLPAIMSGNTIFSAQWQLSEMLPLVATLGVIAAACFGLGYAFKFLSDKTDETSVTITTLNIIGSAYLYVILWRVLHVLVATDIATMSSLIVYTVAGLATNLYGQLHKHRVLRLYGGVLLGLVVARLLIIDIWQMAIPGRIVTFFLIGALLISTAFIGRGSVKIPTKE